MGLCGVDWSCVAEGRRSNGMVSKVSDKQKLLVVHPLCS